jgi:hypothetical protein
MKPGFISVVIYVHRIKKLLYPSNPTNIGEGCVVDAKRIIGFTFFLLRRIKKKCIFGRVMHQQMPQKS